MKRIITTLIAGVVCINAYSQCGPATVSVVNYCPDQYAEFTINDPDPNTKYQWFADAAGTVPLGYGPGGTDGKYFVSPTTYPTGSGTQTFYYQRELSNQTGGAPSAVASSGTGQSTFNPYSMTFDSDVDFVLNEVTIPLHTWWLDASRTFRIKITIGGTPANWYYFTSTDVIASGAAQTYLITVPIDVDGLGNGIPVNAGVGQTISAFMGSDGLENAGTFGFDNFAHLSQAQVNSTYTIGSPGSQITMNQHSNLNGGNVTGFLDWDVTINCPLEATSAIEETNPANCCTPVATQPVVTSQSGEYVFQSPFSENLVAGSSNPVHYFRWFLDGSVVAEGYGMDTYAATATGNYEVRVVEDLADIDRLSCYNESSLINLEEQILFAIASSTNICIGDPLTLEAQGALSNIQWTPAAGNITSPTSATTTANPTQTTTYTVTAEVPSGNLTQNWDFEQGNTQFDVSAGIRNAPITDLTYQNGWIMAPNDPGPHPTLTFANYGSSGNGVYAITDTYLHQNNWALAYDCSDHTTGNGNFYLHDAMENTTMSTYGVTNDLDAYIWKQDVIVSANTAYDFSAWFGNASNSTANPPVIQMYVNDVPVLGTPWQQGANSTDWGTCDWHEVVGTWNSGAYSGPAEIKIVELSHIGSGNDFIMDDVMFSSGTSIQSDDVTINVTDCFTITAQQNTNCVNDSSEIEIVTGGLFLGWNELGGGTTSIKDASAEVTLVSPSTDTRYVGCAQFPMGNLLTNGDFELGNQGFTSGYTVGNSGGQYQITSNANTMNGTWFINNTDNTTGTGNMMVVDGGSNTTQDIWENTVDVVNGQDYAFSVWVQNVHVNMDNPAEMVFMANGMQLGNIDLPDNDQNWIQFFTTWTANTTGTITISIRNDNSGFLGNDFAIDDISFAPLFNETRCDTVDVTACVPPCQPPTALAIDQTGPVELCAGVNQTLSGTYTLHPTPLNTYYYTWFKDGTPVSGPSTSYSDEILNTVAVGDAGTYTLRIEDGNNDAAACYLEDQIVVDVEAQPSTATAGIDQSQCESTTTATLAGNNPASGTGTWTLVSGSGTVTSPNVNNSGVTGLAAGANIFRWTISTGTFCADQTDDITITLDAAPSTSNAGTGATICGTGSTENLTANIPTVGTGTWTTEAGTGTFGNANTASTTVSGLSLGTNTFRWTISEPGLCPDETDEITIVVETPPSAAVAGTNDTICSTPGSTALTATTPTNGTGTWSGAGTFGNVNDPTTTVSGLPVGDNTLTWTVSTGGTCPDEVDQVNVTVDAAPSAATVGSTINLCDGDVLTLNATAPATGTGVWSLVAGTGTITTTTDPASTVTGYNTGVNTYRWTVSNGVCPDETDDVDVNVDAQPTAASVGPDLNVCTADPINLTGNNPATGTGVWTTGPATTGGTIDNTTQFNSSVSGMAGSDVLEAIWTISNGVCPASDDTITITATGVAAPSVTLNVSQSQVCEGTSITFTASGNNGGSSPTYQFFDQNNNPLTGAIATNTYTIAAPTQDTIVYVEMISTSSCLGGNPANINSSNVPVQVDLNPSAADAGPDQTICTSQATLAATAPTIGTGAWTVTSGTGSVTTINDPASTITGLVISTTATVEWAVSNGVCPTTTDDVDITRTGDLTTPLAGTDQTICEDATATLAGNTPNGADVGTWTTTGDGGFTPDVNTPGATYTPGANDIIAGTATLSWTMSNGICPDATDDVTITIDALPSAADAGTDQTLCTDQTTLAAVTPTSGTGMWTVVSGSGTVTTPTDEASTVTGLSQGTTLTLQWEVSNGVCTSTTDQVDIIRTGALTTPNAGPTQTICETGTATLAANTTNAGAGETGTWTTTGDGTFSPSINAPNASYDPGTSDEATGTVTLSWTIDNGGLCPPATDDVMITLDPLPTTANAGTGGSVCTLSLTLGGNPAIDGTGMWTVVTGPGTFADPTDEATLVSNLQDGINELQWTITSGVCPVSTDIVTITKSGDLTSPAAGPNDNICETQTSYQLQGNAVNAGNGETGTWTVIAGTATITTPNDPVTTITGMGVGPITMRWTIDNGGVCPDATDDVNIQVDQSPGLATTGADTSLCGTSMMLNGNTPAVGSGLWTVVAGSGTVTSPSSPTSNITGLSGQTELSWVLTNGVCTNGTNYRIDASQPVTPDVTLTASNSSICEGETVTFNAFNSGPANNGTAPTYEFIHAGTSVQGPSTISSYTTNAYTLGQTIQVIIRPSLTCTTVDSAMTSTGTSVSPAPTVSIPNPDTNVCENVGYTLTAVASPATNIQWYENSGGSPIALFGENGSTLNVPYTGSFIAVVNNADLTCSAVASNTVAVTIDAMPNVDAGQERTLFVGDQISMNGTVSNATSSIWTVDNGEFANVTSPTSQYIGLTGGQQFYTLTAFNGACTNSDNVTINVRVPIRVPNAFTPNLDNLNDVLEIEGLDTYEDVTLEIFNRWGTPVYKSAGVYVPWDGYRGGEPMPVATYYYILSVDKNTDQEQIFTGSVTLVR